ncbi:hypothetical protein B5S25_07035 [Paenibacillus larvae subsp. pulvifaciens]|nr:hypothetical protein B5S25_07035 [Paenibacillus larvae subsp. pulvifaciens]
MIMNAIHMSVEHPKYTELLFSVAEELYLNGLVEESLLFYEEVIEEEKFNHSERLAISHYRVFRASIGSDADENFKAVIRFEGFRKNLPENFQLDALFQLARICFSLKKWNLAEQFADELRILVTIRYQEELLVQRSKRTSEPSIREHPLVVYYGQSYLMKSVALTKQGYYEKAKQYLQGYEDLGWFEILDEHGKKEVDKFRLWAQANKYGIELLLGNTSILDEYTNYLTDHPNEIPAGLCNILEAANTYAFNVDYILDKIPITSIGKEATAIEIERHCKIHYQKAIYAFNHHRFVEGLETILYCLPLSISTKKHSQTLLFVGRFQQYIKHASDSQKEQFANIMKEVSVDEN